MKCNNALIIVITFCNVCRVVHNNKKCDNSVLNGVTVWEGSRTQRCQMLRYVYVIRTFLWLKFSASGHVVDNLVTWWLCRVSYYFGIRDTLLDTVTARAWIWFIWLRLGISGELLWKRQCIFGYHKIPGISWPTDKQLACHEWVFVVELVYCDLAPGCTGVSPALCGFIVSAFKWKMPLSFDETVTYLFITFSLCFSQVYVTYIYIGKGKAVPLQARRGPKGSRKLRFPDFVTTAQDGGKVVSLTHLVLISVRGWVDPRAIVRSEGLYVNGGVQWHQLESNQRPSDLQHSTLTIVLPRSPRRHEEQIQFREFSTPFFSVFRLLLS